MAESDLKNKTARGLLWGGIGNGGMQLLSLMFGVFLSRILVPNDYGIVGALALFTALGGMLSESGFTLALVNKKNIEAVDYSSVFWFNLLVSILCYAILFFAAPFVAAFYNSPEMIPLLRFLSLGFVIGATATAPTAYLFRNLRVKERSKAQIGAMLVSGSVGLICAFASMRYWALAIQNILYIFTNALLLWTQSRWIPSCKFEFSRIKQLLPFSLKQLAVSFFTNVNNNFFPMLLGKYYGMWLSGCYTQGNKWTVMGSNTIKGMIDSVGQPVLREASESEERLSRVFGKLLAFTAFVCFPCMLGLGLVSRELIVLAITDKWIECVPIMQILCVWGAFVPIVVLYGNLFNSSNRPGIYMWNTILPGLLQLLALFITFRFSIYVMLAVYVGINIAWLAIWQVQARRLCHISTRLLLANSLPFFLVAAVAIACAALAAHFVANIYASLAIKIIVAVAVYIIVMSRLKSEIFNEALDFLSRKIGRARRT